MKKSVLTIILISGINLLQAQIFKPDDSTGKRQADVQVTLITPLGTNGLEALKYTNRLSVNILAGANGGVNGIEIGGFGNFIAGDVKGVQAAGFFNVAMKSVNGGQFAGFLNMNGGTLKGAQMAGCINYNEEKTEGGQASGFANINLGKLKGIQAAGFVNYNNDSLKGLQGAGFVNANRGSVKGVQAAGFANFCGGNLHGVQASGFINVARKVKGFQVGYINIADTVDGAAFGFLCINKKGIHQVEIFSDEMFRFNLGLRTGSNSFYNEFNAGFSPQGSKMLWHLGYGCGTSARLSNAMRLDFSLSAHHVSRGLFYNGTSELYRFYTGVEYKVANKCRIAAGPTFNLYWGDTLLPDYATIYKGIAPYKPFLDETNGQGFNFKAWVGGKVTVRFF